jgi:hypothetical protein
MAVLNIREVPEELARRLKSEAALMGKPLREYCISLLERGGRDVAEGIAGAGDTIVASGAKAV